MYLSKYLIARLLLAMGVFAFIANASAGGIVQAWGSFGMTNVPANVTNVTAIAAGPYHTLAINEDGTVSGWGDDTFGKATSPGGLVNVVAVAAGANHSLA